MTREQLERALEELDRQRQIVIKELRGIKTGDFTRKSNKEEADVDSLEEKDSKTQRKEEIEEDLEQETLSDVEEESTQEPKTIATAAKDAVKNAVTSGNLKSTMGKISGGLDFAKVAVNSFSDILDKAQEKIHGNIEELPGPTGIPIMTDMWVPMFLGLMQTQEFQHLMANMLVQVIKN